MAGLFALLCGMFTVGVKTATDVHDGVKIENARKYAQKNNNLTYYVGAQEFFLENNVPCRTYVAENGHRIIEGTGKYYGKLLYDYDAGKEEKLQSQFENDLAIAKERGYKYLNIEKYEEYPAVEIGNGLYMEVESGQKYSLRKGTLGKNVFYKLYYLEDIPTYKTRLYGGGGDAKQKMYLCKKDSDGNDIYKTISENEYYERFGSKI